MIHQLIHGLGAAIGSRFLPVHNQLLFMEYSGKVSILDQGLDPPSTGGEVSAAPSQITASVATLLGPCAAPPGVAGFAEHVYVAAKMINGEARQSQYDASAAIAFVLAPG